MGRELVNIHSSDIVVIVSGRSGTLGEFAIAYEEGKLIGVLTGTGGIPPALPALEESLRQKATGSQVIYDADPETLVDRLLERHLADRAAPDGSAGAVQCDERQSTVDFGHCNANAETA